MLSQIIIAMACGFNKPINNPTRSFKYVGDIAPLGFFDPLKISNDDGPIHDKTKLLGFCLFSWK